MIFLQCLFQSTNIQRHPDTALILCRSYQAEALHATVSEGLAQGPYVAAKVEFKPATLQTHQTNHAPLSVTMPPA